MTYQERLNKYSIEIDCPPGNPRPADLIAGVLADTGLEVTDFDAGAAFFGYQAWVLKDDPDLFDVFTAMKPVYGVRLTALYRSGVVRYATW